MALRTLRKKEGQAAFNPAQITDAATKYAVIGRVLPNRNVINLRPNSLFCRKISSIHHHLKESEMNSVPAVPTTDQAVLPKII